MTDSRKLTITLPNGATFNADGTDDFIKEYFERFMAAATTIQPAPPKHIEAAPAIQPSPNGSNSVTSSDLPMDRLFSQAPYYGVALMGKPKGENVDADGLLALLYGFATVLSDTSVTAIKLMRAANKSGLDTPRLDRVLAKHSTYVTESGKGKGKRYGLNNPGMAKAEQILRGILG